MYVVKKYTFKNPVITRIHSITDECYRDCHNKYFHTFNYVCIYDIKLTNITNNEVINITISVESMNLFDLNKKLTVARQRGYIFNQINKLTLKMYSHLRYISISYYLKFPIPMCHRQFFTVISQNRDHVEKFCMIQKILFILHVRKGKDQSNKLKIVSNFIIQ